MVLLLVVLVDFASWFWWFVVSPPPRPARGARQGPLAGRPSSWVPPKTPGCQGTKRWVPAREPRGAEEAFGTCQGPRSADEAFDAPQEPRGPSTPDAPKRDHASGGKRLLLQITFETKILLSFPWFWLVEPIKRYDAE